jgi:glycosyltransferase involved in cell wall biosynthesis
MKFILISPKNRTAWNFRGDLIREIIATGTEVIVTGPDLEGVEHILELGARFEQVPLRKNGTGILADLKYTWLMWRLMRKEKPDVTLGYTIKPVIYGAIAARLAGVQNINSMVTGGGYLFITKSFRAKALKLLATLLYRIGFLCAHKVIFQNLDDMEEFTLQRGLVPIYKARLVNGSGVNMEHFKPAPYPETITFFMLSRIMYNKGVKEYLEAARLVKLKHPHVRFILLGAVENIQDSMSASELQLYIDDQIVDYFEETPDVRPYYRQCSVYVLPSYREGTPRTVLEAMAMARPIITTNTQGCRDTVLSGLNGFLVPVKDINALAEKMEWFILNPQAIKKMGKESLKMCKEKYDVKKVNGEMMKWMSGLSFAHIEHQKLQPTIIVR